MWSDPLLQSGFDIIIEDGLHTINANVCFFENSIHKLNAGGYYVIEDIVNTEEQLFIDKIAQWETIYTDCVFKLVKIPSFQNTFDNTLLVIHKKM